MDTRKEKDILEIEKENVAELLKINYLTPENAEFQHTKGGFVSLKTNDRFYKRVNFHRTFPFTDKDSFISVREPDDKAREIGIIENLQAFDAETVKILNEQMNLRYFTPKILKIFSIKEEYGYAYWSVLTDKGPCKFTMSTGSGSTAKVTDRHVLIKDIDENRYEIMDLDDLTTKELKKIDLYI